MGKPKIKIQKVTPKTGEPYFRFTVICGNGKTANHKYNTSQSAEKQAIALVNEIRNEGVTLELLNKKTKEL